MSEDNNNDNPVLDPDANDACPDDEGSPFIVGKIPDMPDETKFNLMCEAYTDLALAICKALGVSPNRKTARTYVAAWLEKPLSLDELPSEETLQAAFKLLFEEALKAGTTIRVTALIHSFCKTTEMWTKMLGMVLERAQAGPAALVEWRHRQSQPPRCPCPICTFGEFIGAQIGKPIPITGAPTALAKITAADLPDFIDDSLDKLLTD